MRFSASINQHVSEASNRYNSSSIISIFAYAHFSQEAADAEATLLGRPVSAALRLPESVGSSRNGAGSDGTRQLPHCSLFP